MALCLQKLKGLLKRLPPLHPIPSGVVRDANLHAPMFEAQSFSTYGKDVGISSIQNLIHPRSPLAIVFIVSLVVVDSIKSHALRAIPHVGMEIFKLFHPPVTNLYPSATVIIKPWPIRVIATILHALPSMINRGPGHAVFSLQFNGKASARRNKATPKVAASACCFFAAITNTVPHSVLTISRIFSYHGKSTKFLTSNVDNHNSPLLGFIKYNTVGC
jgi:hypothetical protein